jgi:hypothetical protein
MASVAAFGCWIETVPPAITPSVGSACATVLDRATSALVVQKPDFKKPTFLSLRSKIHSSFGIDAIEMIYDTEGRGKGLN